MLQNGSIAIWCMPRHESAPTQLEMHVNYWRLAGEKSYIDEKGVVQQLEDLIEIGVLIDDIQQIDCLCIYMPTNIERSRIIDCASYLSKPHFAQGIFNEVISITNNTSGGPRCVVLRTQDESIIARVHRFAEGSANSLISERELALTSENDGTLLTITPTAVEVATKAGATGKTYFRLRIPLKNDANPFVRVIKPLDQLFQSGYDEIEYIDFRLNEARTLPEAIEQRMHNDSALGGDIKTRLVAFLTAVPVQSEISVSNTASHKMRLLEPFWSEYVGAAIPDGMAVYHWKKLPEPDRPITDFSAFVKLRTRRTSRRILRTYLLIAFAIGLLGNWTAEGLLELAKHLTARFSNEQSEQVAPPATKTDASVPERPAEAPVASQSLAPEPNRSPATQGSKPAIDTQPDAVGSKR